MSQAPLLTPPSYDVITVFVDETYLDDHSALIQTAVPLTRRGIEVFDEVSHRLLAEDNRPNLKEFKAKNIDERNQSLYAKFLQRAINVIAETSLQSPLRAIITIESMDVYRGPRIASLINQVKGARKKVGCVNEPKVFEELARQADWIVRFFKCICPTPVQHHFSFVFDAKFRHYYEGKAMSAVQAPNGGPVIFWENSKMLTSFLNTILEVASDGQWHPQVHAMSFELSESHRALQACDTLCNLTLNSLRFRAGLVDALVRMKHEMLAVVSPGMEGPIKDLTVQGDKLICTNKTLRGKYILDPIPPDASS